MSNVLATVKVIKPRVESKTWWAKGQPQPALKVMWSLFKTSFPEFTRRADRITNMHADVMSQELKSVFGKEFPRSGVYMQLLYSFGKYHTDSDQVFTHYDDHDQAMIAYQKKIQTFKQESCTSEI